MKRYVAVGMILIAVLSASVFAETIPEDIQKEIIADYMYATGQLSDNQLATYELANTTQKCGMSPIYRFRMNYNKLDKNLLKSLGVQVAQRPVLPDTRVSPSGRFLIHYTTVGDSAVYSNITGGATGYVDSVARILDDVYSYTIDTLGYPPPPTDGFYPSGGDDKYDVYLVDIGFYGLAYTDSILYNFDSSQITATAYLELENDFDNLIAYQNNPLDAIRVTAAHEFFHMVQFGIDVTESEKDYVNGVEGPAWMEMSSVWMEEEQYDNINDYYYYLPYFFNEPWASIQQFKAGGDLHPYASGIFPIYMAEKYGRDIIKAIWIKCGEDGPGPQSLQAIGVIIDSLSSGAETYQSMFSEFALWNYFTGDRASLAPAGIGYSERNSYAPEFTDNPTNGTIRVHTSYPISIPGNSNSAYNPESNSAFYLSLKKIDHLVPIYKCLDSSVAFDTTYWVCNSGAFPNCTDSTEVTALDPYDTLYVDTFVCNDSVNVLDFITGVDGNFIDPWGLNIIYHYKYYYDSIDVENIILPIGWGGELAIPDPSQYNEITFIYTPGSSYAYQYNNGRNYYVGTFVLNESDTATIDTTLYHAVTPTDIFYPYPNPAVYDDMVTKTIRFSFTLAIDSTFLIESSNPGDSILADINALDAFLLVDIYNINGERVRSLKTATDMNTVSNGNNEIIEWDMKNESGKDVASGVYFAYARLTTKDKDGKLLSEQKTKVAIIR